MAAIGRARMQQHTHAVVQQCALAEVLLAAAPLAAVPALGLPVGVRRAVRHSVRPHVEA